MAELPSSVSTEYTPNNFGAGTRTTRTDGKIIYEAHADKRKAGTSLRSRIHHVTDEKDRARATTLVLTPGATHQTIEITRSGDPVARVVKVNGNHIEMEVRDNEQGELLEAKKFGFSGDNLGYSTPTETPPQAGLFEQIDTPDYQNVPKAITLPVEISANEVLLLSAVGDIMREPGRHMPSQYLVSLSALFPAEIQSSLPLE